MEKVETLNKKTLSAWEPLKVPLFRSLWIANTASNIGTWIQDVGGSWYMTSITTSPILISLMQSATSLPLFLLALPAGVLSDLFDRRKILIITSIWVMISAAVLGFMVLAGLKSPIILLTLTVILNLGAAFFVPTWQASIPEMVPKEQLAGAFAINGASLNVARAVGPAIGGFILVSFGAWANYLLNAGVTVVMIVLFFRWKPAKQFQTLPTERFFTAMKASFRYVRNSKILKTILIKTAIFIVPATALFSMLPLIVKKQLAMGPTIYGLLLGFVGMGALLGVYLLPRITARISVNRISQLSTLALVFPVLILALVTYIPLISLVMFCAGFAWLLALSSLRATIASTVPQWVRGRALSFYLLVFYGGMTMGAALWGYLAMQFGINYSLIIAASVLLLGTLLSSLLKLPPVENLDLSPSGRWAEPNVVREFKQDDQAVMVSIEYFVNPDQRAAFKAAMRELKTLRKRDGAFSWMLSEDVADASRYVETFCLESWLEHLRQHQRGTLEDLAIEDRAKGFHNKTEPPKVSHLLITK